MLPQKGSVSIMCITDKQFGDIKVFYGAKEQPPQAPGQQLELFWIFRIETNKPAIRRVYFSKAHSEFYFCAIRISTSSLVAYQGCAVALPLKGNEFQANHNILMSWPDDIQLNLADRAISDRPCHFLHSVALTLSYWNRAISMNELIIPREIVSSSITAESQSMSLRNTCLSLARVQKKQTAIPLALREYPSVEWWHRNGVEF